MTTKLNTGHVQIALQVLGYYDGAINSDPHDEDFRDSLRVFQLDYRLKDDGWYGDITEAKLLPLVQAFNRAPSELTAPGTQMRRWQSTTYYVGDVTAWSGPQVSMHVLEGAAVETVNLPAGAFVEAALEGSTRLADNRLVGVTQPAYGVCNPVQFAPVYEIARRNGWIPEKAGYAGIVAKDGKVIQSRNFELREASKDGYPIEHGVPCVPFRTLAADIGVLAKHDPMWKGKGGVVPLNTRVWILELAGLKLPGGTVHDGWCAVNDTGGGIYGAHFDIFTGTHALAKQVKIPGRLHVWFDGIEQKLPSTYSYGLA